MSRTDPGSLDTQNEGPPRQPAPEPRRTTRTILERLGPEKLEQLRLDFIAGVTQRQIAEQYDISLPSVKRLTRGLRND